MSLIKNNNDFLNITSNITSFSHAYLFSVNSLEKAFPYLLLFAKQIICNKYKDDCNECDICYQIDHQEFDDLYIVNPDSIGINSSEIENLFNYMQTKSVRDNGRRVYIIYGIERLSRVISNKLLKFLEEPQENIYAILLTSKNDQILSTIVSRCQIIELTFEDNDIDLKLQENMEKFIKNVLDYREKAIAYINDYWFDYLSDRKLFFNAFQYLENILSNEIQNYYKNNDLKMFKKNFSIKKIVEILNITIRLKSLILKNINLNLLLDRYIIEVSKELI